MFSILFCCLFSCAFSYSNLGEPWFYHVSTSEENFPSPICHNRSNVRCLIDRVMVEFNQIKKLVLGKLTLNTNWFERRRPSTINTSSFPLTNQTVVAFADKFDLLAMSKSADLWCKFIETETA